MKMPTRQYAVLCLCVGPIDELSVYTHRPTRENEITNRMVATDYSFCTRTYTSNPSTQNNKG